MNLDSLTERLRREFRARHERAPRWIAAAPGRVNLIGEHTDYNDGFVLPMAIDRYTAIAAAPNNSNRITLGSMAAGEIVEIDLSAPIAPQPRGQWENYPRGVVAGFMEAGVELTGFDALIDSTVPIGGGLSSSAALEVAIATLLEAVSGRVLPPLDKAMLCQQAEHRHAGVPCGVMDQMVSTFGSRDHLLLLDCRSRVMRFVPLSEAVSVLIVNTGVKHALAGSEYSLRRKQCEIAANMLGIPSLRDARRQDLEQMRPKMGDELYRRARHVVDENARALMAAESIRERDWLAVGQLMYVSHDSLRDDYEVSCPELDAAVEIVQDIGPRGGVYGCRMTGGGFGGCVVALIDSSAEESVIHKVSGEFAGLIGKPPAVFVSRPTQGARMLES